MAISEYYFPCFEVFAKENTIEKYLSIVESAFKLKAVSRMELLDFGSLYQTGKQYNLKIDSMLMNEVIR
jgi:hypothetical protein